jgi:hypothetical protein
MVETQKQNRAIDFDKVRRRRRRLAALKRLLGLMCVFALLYAGLLFYRYLVELGFSTRLDDIRASFGGTGFPAELPAGQSHIVKNIGNSLAVLNDTGLYIYNPKAKLIRTVQRLGIYSAAVASKDRLLAYTPGSKSYAVHAVSRELFSAELEFGAICGDINDNGDFAITAPTKQFPAKVSVFNNRFEELYTWSSPEYVSEVSLAKDGSGMALNVLSGSGGVLESLIYLFDFAESREQAEVALRLPGELTLDIFHRENGDVAVLTDKQLLIMSGGKKTRGYSFGGRELLACEPGAEHFLLLQDAGEGRQSLALLDANLNERATKTLAANARDIALSRDSVYVLGAEGIEVYGLALEPKARLSAKGISAIHPVGGQLYYLTENEIRALSPAEMVGMK